MAREHGGRAQAVPFTRYDSQLRIFPSLPEALSAPRQNRETRLQAA